MTAAERERLRAARDMAVRDLIASERERQRHACACPVCVGEASGVHGEALYNDGCRCRVCRADRTFQVRRRKNVRRRVRA